QLRECVGRGEDTVLVVLVFVFGDGDHGFLPSVPTRRSSDLSMPLCVSASVGRKHYETTRRGFEPSTSGQVWRGCRRPGGRCDVCTENIRWHLVRMERAYRRKQQAN